MVCKSDPQIEAKSRRTKTSPGFRSEVASGIVCVEDDNGMRYQLPTSHHVHKRFEHTLYSNGFFGPENTWSFTSNVDNDRVGANKECEGATFERHKLPHASMRVVLADRSPFATDRNSIRTES